MSSKGISSIISGYHILWEALKYYESRLEKLSPMESDEGKQLSYDEKFQDIDGVLNSIKAAARSDFDLEFE
jgi:hypothetical protein